MHNRDTPRISSMGTPTVLAYISYNVCLRGLDPAAPQHAQAHAHKQTHAQTHIHTRAHTRTRTCKHTHSHTHSHTHTHTHLCLRVIRFFLTVVTSFQPLLPTEGGGATPRSCSHSPIRTRYDFHCKGKCKHTHARTYQCMLF